MIADGLLELAGADAPPVMLPPVAETAARAPERWLSFKDDAARRSGEAAAPIAAEPTPPAPPPPPPPAPRRARR